jgi:hypothetical protein
MSGSSVQRKRQEECSIISFIFFKFTRTMHSSFTHPHSQIPKSFAANAFNVFERSMHEYEIVRLCALWDRAELDKESVPTIIDLIDDEQVLAALADEVRQHWNGKGVDLNPSDDPELRRIEQEAIAASETRFANEQAAKVDLELREAIANARRIIESPQLNSLRNLRDKHLAHSLSATHREKNRPVAPMKYGDETELLEASIPIIERLCCWVRGVSFDVADSREVDRSNAEALWKGCTFKVLR